MHDFNVSSNFINVTEKPPISIDVIKLPTYDLYVLILFSLNIASTSLLIIYNSICEVAPKPFTRTTRSEEHTSELQSRFDLVCRLLLEKKKATTVQNDVH